MDITLYHKIIPPIIAVVSIVFVVVIFMRAYKRVRKDVAHKERGSENEVSSTKEGNCSGNSVSIATHVGVAESVPTVVQKRIDNQSDETSGIVEREKMLIKRIAADPRDTEAYTFLGQLYMVQNNLGDAAECYGQVIALDPKDLKAVNQLNRIKKMIMNTKVREEGLSELPHKNSSESELLAGNKESVASMK